MKTIQGTICGKDLFEIHFLYPSVQNGKKAAVALGEVLIAEDNQTHERYLLRVTNIGYAQNEIYAKEVARDMSRINHYEGIKNEHKTPEERFSLHSVEKEFIEATCEMLGMIDENGKFKTAKTLPSAFSVTRQFDENDFRNSLKNYLGDIKFGKFRSGYNIMNTEVGIFSELFSQHVGIFAQSGNGKSNLMKVIIGSVLEQRGKFSLLIFDPHGEYLRDLKHHPLYKEGMVAYSKDGREGSEVFQINESDISVSALMNLRSVLNWSEPQERFLDDAREIIGADDWISVLTTTNIAEILEEYKEIHDKKAVQAAVSKLKRITKDKFYINNRAKSDCIERIKQQLNDGKSILLDMANMDEVDELLISSILSAKVLNQRKYLHSHNESRFNELPPVGIVLEEASRVLGVSSSNGGLFSKICKEGRKFKTSLFPIAQEPREISPSLLSQFSTLIILSLTNAKDLTTVIDAAKNPIEQIKGEIKKLMPGEAIITSLNAPFAMPVKVHHYRAYLSQIKNKYKRKQKVTANSVKGMV